MTGYHGEFGNLMVLEPTQGGFLAELAGKMPDKEVARILARATGAKRNAVYQRLIDIKSRGDDGDGGS